MTYTDEDVERVALKICEALGDWNPVPMNKMAYEDAARAALFAMPRHVPEWQDIATAPIKSGEEFLVSDGEFISLAIRELDGTLAAGAALA